MQLVYQKHTGLFPEQTSIAPPVFIARATIPVLEALEVAGATALPLPPPDYGYRITLGKVMPAGIVAVHLNSNPHIGLRLDVEDQYPIEFPDYWAQVDFTPCPQCGAPVVWYEAGFVPGYRVCTQPPHHHLLAE